MGYQEDKFYEMSMSIKNNKLEEQFFKNLKSLESKPKHKHKSVWDKWEYAFEKLKK